MADWRRTLRLQPEWGLAKEYEISIQELAGVIAKRLRSLADFGSGLDQERDEIADELEDLSEDKLAYTSELDSIMCRLYEWGDQPIGRATFSGPKVCWIDTMTMPELVRT